MTLFKQPHPVLGVKPLTRGRPDYPKMQGGAEEGVPTVGI